MLTVLIILWILWRLCRPWYGDWHRPPMGRHHYRRVPMWHHPAPMGSVNGSDGFSGFHGGDFSGAGGGGGVGRGRR